jgi:manganese efflux pump family protein
MDPLSMVVIGAGLAMDAFAVAVVASLNLGRVSFRQVFRFGFHFGLFQALMPVLGWGAGRIVAEPMQRFGPWIAFGLLLAVGLRTIGEATKDLEADDPPAPTDPTRGFSLIFFSVATSIDALAVGVSFAVLDVNIWQAVACIGVITAALTTVGMIGGSRIGRRLGDKVEILGGVLLIGIGAKILVQHLWF